MKHDIARTMAAASKRTKPRRAGKGNRKLADAARALRRIQLSEVLDGIKRIEQIDQKCRAQLTKLTGVGYLDLRIIAVEKRIEELERFHAAAKAGGFSAIVAAPATPPAGDFAAILAPSVEAALDRAHAPGVEEIADELVADLFRNGQGNTAARLEQIGGDGRMQGGWGPGPVRDRVLAALRRAATAPAAVLEAIQDEEAILRLALAIRALGRGNEWDESPALDVLASELADYLENPEAARAAIRAADARNTRTRRIR